MGTTRKDVLLRKCIQVDRIRKQETVAMDWMGMYKVKEIWRWPA